jgi:hypothetical protein
MKYTFTCPHDGEYEVDQQTLEKFLSKELRWRLHSKLRRDSNIVEVKLKFPRFCPKCKPDGVDIYPTLSIIRIKGQIH